MKVLTITLVTMILGLSLTACGNSTTTKDVSIDPSNSNICLDENGNPILVGSTNINIEKPPETSPQNKQASSDPKSAAEEEKYKPPMIVKLGRDNCIPCIEMNKILDEVRAIVGDKAIVKIIDIQLEPGAPDQYGIRVIPTEIFFDGDGKEIYRVEGVIQKDEVLSWLRKGGGEL